MKVLEILVVVGIVGVYANDRIWIELMTAQTAEATGDSESNKIIPEVATDLGLKILVDLVKKAGLADALSGPGPFTIFGPVDEAFTKLPKEFMKVCLKNVTVLADVLKYHVADSSVLSKDLTNDQLIPSLLGKAIRINIYKNGKVITASGRPVKLADQEASNGVIHEVDGVLFPPPGSITYSVSKCPVFKTLAKAVGVIPDIARTLDGSGPFTLFAPSEKAFKRIPKKCIDALLKNTTLLEQVLKYHVVPSTGYSAGLSCGDELKTVEGGMVKITKMFGHIRVNSARVTYADGTTTNGVIHVIDRVLFPRGSDDLCDDSNLDYDDDSYEKENDEDLDITAFKALINSFQ